MQDCACLLGLELVCYCPTRAFCRHSQRTLLGQRIYLQYDTVGGYGELLAVCVPVCYVVPYVLQGVAQLDVVADVETPLACRLHALVVSFARQVFAQQVIEVCVQAAVCHDARVLALKRAACGIARVGKQLFAFFRAFAVEAFKTAPGHEDFASYFKFVRNPSIKNQRYGTYGTYVACHVVALHTVTACNCLYKTPFLVMECNGKTVVFEFGTYLEGLSVKSVRNSLVEFAYFVQIVCVGK